MSRPVGVGVERALAEAGDARKDLVGAFHPLERLRVRVRRMKEMKWLRWVNMCGAAVFVLYGVLLGALPVIFLNLFIGGVNGWRLISDKPEVVYSNS